MPLNLLLLGKAFLTLDGVARQLDPGFNAWLETPAYASEVFASEVVVRTWSIHSRGSTGSISIVSGCPRERSRLISRARSEKGFVHMQQTCWRVSEIRAMFYAEAQESPGALTKKRSKGKNMSDEAVKKATAATSETMDEVFQEAMRSYEKALKSGIQLQEESVNLWKDLLTKLGSPEEFQAKLESMTADAFPKARQRMEEFVETFHRMSNQTIDLFEKTLGVYQATSVPEAQRRVQDLVESSLAALRVNVRSALDTNAKIIVSWKELVDRFGPAVK